MSRSSFQEPLTSRTTLILVFQAYRLIDYGLTSPTQTQNKTTDRRWTMLTYCFADVVDHLQAFGVGQECLWVDGNVVV